MKLEQTHIPVLLKESLFYLNLKPGKIVFDGTLGGAGHTVAIYKAIAPTGKLIAVDQDSQAISTASITFKNFDNIKIFKGNFADIKSILKEAGIKKIDGLFLDLGLSSTQIEKSGRGFSYMRDEKLDMRMNEDNPLTAYEILNSYQEEELVNIFYKYGEEPYSKSIARNIVNYRKLKKIETTGELNEIIKKSIPLKALHGSRGHPAKRVFQALRIEVNKELENLERVIDDGFEALNKNGRMVIISYHSLEDRIVKNKFLNFSGKCTCPPELPKCMCGAKKRALILTKKVVVPSKEEIEQNIRAKSAKLRAIEKI